MSMNITSLPEIAQFLEDRGYEPTLNENSVSLIVGEFPTVVTANEERLTISTQLLLLGQIPAHRQADFLLAATDLNSRILPFAVATITSSDNDELSDPDTFPVVLIDSIPTGDLHPDELQSAFDSLLAALVQTRPILELVFAEEDNESPRPLLRKSQISRSQMVPFAERLGYDLDDLLLLAVASGLLEDDGEFIPDEPLLEDEPVISETSTQEPVAEEEAVEPGVSSEEDSVSDVSSEETPAEESVAEEEPTSERSAEPAPVVEEASDPLPTSDDDSSRLGSDPGFDSGSVT